MPGFQSKKHRQVSTKDGMHMILRDERLRQRVRMRCAEENLALWELADRVVRLYLAVPVAEVEQRLTEASKQIGVPDAA